MERHFMIMVWKSQCTKDVNSLQTDLYRCRTIPNKNPVGILKKLANRSYNLYGNAKHQIVKTFLKKKSRVSVSTCKKLGNRHLVLTSSKR